MMLVHPIKTVVLDVFGTGKTQIELCKNERVLDQNFAMAVRGRYFQGLLYIVKKGCEKGKIAGYGGKTVVVLPMKSPGMGWGF